MPIKTQNLTITPDRAAKMLTTIEINRPLSKNAVAAMVRDMQAGNWRLNGDAIRLDTEGHVLDGEHRLTACVQANTPFQTLMVTGLNKDDRLTIDRGRTRSVGDNLTIAYGVQGGKLVASAIRNMVIFARQDLAANPTVAEHVEIMQLHPKIVDSAVLTKGSSVGRPSILAAIHYIGSFVQDEPERADAFVSVFQTGLPDYEGDAAHMLREMLLRERTRGVMRLDFKTYSLFSHAWEKFCARTPVKFARAGSDFKLKGWDETVMRQAPHYFDDPPALPISSPVPKRRHAAHVH